MGKIKLIFFLLVITTIASCSNKDVTKEVYYHEKSVVTFWTEDDTLQHDTSTEVTFTAVYKNDIHELSKVQQLEIGYNAGSAGSSICENYDEGGPDRRAFTITSSSGLATYEADTIKATLRIDDSTETIELTKK